MISVWSAVTALPSGPPFPWGRSGGYKIRVIAVHICWFPRPSPVEGPAWKVGTSPWEPVFCRGCSKTRDGFGGVRWSGFLNGKAVWNRSRLEVWRLTAKGREIAKSLQDPKKPDLFKLCKKAIMKYVRAHGGVVADRNDLLDPVSAEGFDRAWVSSLSGTFHERRPGKSRRRGSTGIGSTACG